MKRFKKDHLSHGDTWYFLKKDFVHKKRVNRKLYTKNRRTTASAEKIPPVRIRKLRSYELLGPTVGDSVTTESDKSESNFDADGPGNVKRRKHDVDHENQSEEMEKDGSEEIQYVDNDDQSNCSETGLGKSLKKIYTENRGKKNISTLCL